MSTLTLRTGSMLVWVLLAAPGGCGRGQTQPKHRASGSAAGERGHAHGDHGSSALRFGKDTELFLEHPPLVAGQAVTFTAHFTRLGKRFVPIRKGSLVVTLEGASGKITRLRADRPTRPGIFEVRATAPAAGEHRLTFALDAEGARDRFTWKVTVHATTQEAARAAARANSGRRKAPRAGGEELSFSKEQQWTIPFATATAERRALRPGFEVAGTVDVEPGAHARLTAPIGGVVSELAPGLDVGTRVKANQPLASVEPVLLHGSDLPQLQLALVHAQQALKLAELRHKRLRAMLRARAISQLEVDRAEYEVKRHQAAVQAAGSRLWLHQKRLKRRHQSGHGVQVSAPFAGTVVQRAVTRGAAVVAGQLLVEVADLSRLRVVAHVAPSDLVRARQARAASLRLPGGPWVALKHPPALGARVDERTRTVPLYYGWAAAQGLPLGTWVQVRLLGAERKVVAVPDAAVLDRSGQAVVWVQTHGESFELRKVGLGVRDRGWTEVTLGLRAKERVVTRGGDQMLLGATLRGGVKLGHGHAH